MRNEELYCAMRIRGMNIEGGAGQRKVVRESYECRITPGLARKNGEEFGGNVPYKKLAVEDRAAGTAEGARS